MSNFKIAGDRNCPGVNVREPNLCLVKGLHTARLIISKSLYLLYQHYLVRGLHRIGKRFPYLNSYQHNSKRFYQHYLVRGLWKVRIAISVGRTKVTRLASYGLADHQRKLVVEGYTW